MAGLLALIYGGVAYTAFLATFLYAIGFVGNIGVPKSIDSGAAAATPGALIVDVLLLGLFAIQHSGMARPAFKDWFTRIVPKPIDRSTYVLLSSLVLLLMFWQWRPFPQEVWNVTTQASATLVDGLFVLGWLVVLTSTFMINHFDLFDLRRVCSNFTNRPLTPTPFTSRGLCRIVRHPIMLGFLIAFWAIPRMTVGHLLFAIATTGYILIALQFEERDLARHYGSEYEHYRQQTPMLIPVPKRQVGAVASEAQ